MATDDFTTEAEYAEILATVLATAGYRDQDRDRWVSLHAAAERSEVGQRTIEAWLHGEGLSTVAAFSRVLEAHGYEIRIKRSTTHAPEEEEHRLRGVSRVRTQDPAE